jgi:nitric oxide reductase large subunit
MTEQATSTCLYSDPVIVEKSGSVISFVYPNATNQNFQYRRQDCSTSYTQPIPTAPTSTNSITSGDLVLSTFLFIILLLMIFSYIIFRYSGIKIKRYF